MKYDFDTIVPRRGTNSYKWDTPKEKNVLPMWVADMDFEIPPELKQILLVFSVIPKYPKPITMRSSGGSRAVIAGR